MIEFRKTLQNYLLNEVKDWVGVGSDPTKYVRTFDDHLHDFDLDVNPEPWPFVVVNVRSVSASEPGEIGTPFAPRAWNVHIYYISIDENYATGQDKRDFIVGKLCKELEKLHDMGRLSSTDSSGVKETVYDSQLSDVLFDTSGQEEYYSFVSEIYLTVLTEKN